MDSPRYTVIVPMRQFRAGEPVLTSLRETVPAATGGVQILVAEGGHPARQRNLALARAEGEIVVFLDNDCSLAPDFWPELAAAFARPGVEIVGGPARLRPQAGAGEEIFHTLLTHPLVVGPVCARYAPRGSFRATTEMELILCNLAARRSIFAKIGPLSTELFPNEENEWLDRAQAAGAGIYYDPGLQVFRPQRAAWPQMGAMLVRNGMGRTRQFRVSGWRATPHHFLPVILLLPPLALVLGSSYLMGFAFLWLATSAVVALTCDSRLRGWRRIVAGLAAPLIPFTYAVGQVFGWIALFFPRPVSSAEIVLLNERGDLVP